MYAPNVVSYGREHHYMRHLHALEYRLRVVIAFFFSPAIPVRANHGMMGFEKRALNPCKVSGACPPGLQECAAMLSLIRPLAAQRYHSLLCVVGGLHPHRTQELPNGPFGRLVIFFVILGLREGLLYAWRGQ